jgi:hypothetical protein
MVMLPQRPNSKMLEILVFQVPPLAHSISMALPIHPAFSALANSGVVASTYGSTLKIPVLTVNAKGLITGVSEQNIPIVDDLTTNDGSKPLSARQGKQLQDEKLSLSGGQLSGKLTTKPSVLAQNLDDIGTGNNSPLHVPRQTIPFDTTGYIHSYMAQ